MLIGVVDILSGIVVLDYLVFYDTHSGFFHCHFCQRQTCVVCSQRSCPEDLVYLFLRECRKLCLCLTHFLQLAFQRRNAIHQRSVVLCLIHSNTPFLGNAETVRCHPGRRSPGSSFFQKRERFVGKYSEKASEPVSCSGRCADRHETSADVFS